MTSLPPITVFDVETTGLDPRKGDRIVEIAGVRIENGSILKDMMFCSYVNPERPIPEGARRVHNIADADVAAAPTIMTVLPQFLDFARGSTLVAHNAGFDMSFLQAEKEFCWGYVELPECFCTMRLSQSLFPREFRHNLDIVSQRLQIPPTQERHRALGDVLVTSQALLKMIETARITSMDELRKRAGFAAMAV